jgi:hypothetical protein
MSENGAVCSKMVERVFVMMMMMMMMMTTTTMTTMAPIGPVYKRI